MDKFPGRRFKFYTKTSSTVGTTARESSLSTLPPTLLQANFLDPKDLEDSLDSGPPPVSSLASRICVRLREFRQRCVAKVPCIDRFLSPSRPGPTGSRYRVGVVETTTNSKLVRYRRRKSHRQLELARRQVDICPLKTSNDLLSTVDEGVIDTSVAPQFKLTSADPVPVKLVHEGERFRCKPKLLPPRIRPRKMYTPDGKVIHYVVPCHSDSSLSDHRPRNCHKITQVNTESLMKLEVLEQQLLPPFDTGQSKGDPSQIVDETPARIGRFDLPNAIVSKEDVRVPIDSNQLVKRVTFWDDLDVYNANVIDIDEEELTQVPILLPCALPTVNCGFKKNRVQEVDEFQEDDENFEEHFRTPEKRPFTKSPGTSRSKSGERKSPVPKELRPTSRPASSGQTSPRSVPIRPKTKRRKSLENALSPEIVSETWRFDREVQRRRPPSKAKTKLNPTDLISKVDVSHDLTLKYGRFPKVLQMKTGKVSSPRGFRSGSNTSLTSYNSRRLRPESAEIPRYHQYSYSIPTGLRIRANGRVQSPELKSKRGALPPRASTAIPGGGGREKRNLGTEKLKRFLAHPNGEPKWNERLELTNQLPIGRDNLSLANHLFRGYLIGSREQVKKAMTAGRTVRPASAT